MKPNSTWYANSQRIRILMMSVISGHAVYAFEKTTLIQLAIYIQLIQLRLSFEKRKL